VSWETRGTPRTYFTIQRRPRLFGSGFQRGEAGAEGLHVWIDLNIRV
jgi:hypothetical protein